MDKLLVLLTWTSDVVNLVIDVINVFRHHQRRRVSLLFFFHFSRARRCEEGVSLHQSVGLSFRPASAKITIKPQRAIYSYQFIFFFVLFFRIWVRRTCPDFASSSPFMQNRGFIELRRRNMPVGSSRSFRYSFLNA